MPVPRPRPVVSKFATRRPDGSPIEHFLVEVAVVPPPVVEPKVGHLVLVVDASGSMYGDMLALRSMLEKVLVTEELQDDTLKISLASYSSAGDLRIHAEAVPVRDMLRPGSRLVEEIRTLSVRGMTCISQGLAWAAARAVPGETTAIVLMSDGYCNDTSPATERRAIEGILANLQRNPEVLVTTVAFRESSDFVLLDGIAAAMSGRCVLAQTLRGVVDAIHDTAALLRGRVSPAIVLAAEDADLVLAHAVGRQQVNGNTTDLTLRGLSAGEEVRAWRLRKVRPEVWDACAAPDLSTVQDGALLRPLYVFCRAELARGRVNRTKAALIATRDQELLRVHAAGPPAGPRLAMLAEALDAVLYLDTLSERPRRPGPNLELGLSLLELFAWLEPVRAHVSLDLPGFLAHYQKRSEKRLSGSFDETGAFISVTTTLVADDDPTMVGIRGIKINNAEATVNLEVARSATPRDRAGNPIVHVAGQRLDHLTEFRTYTLVADGMVTSPVLPLRISRKEVYEGLRSQNVLTAESRATPYDHRETFEVDLASLPVVPWAQRFPLHLGVFRALCGLSTLASILRACLPEGKAAAAWTPEQRTELEARHLTPGLSWSPPTTTPFPDREIAIQKGWLDSFTRYQVSLMDREIGGVEALWSANEYLKRRFLVKHGEGTAKRNKEGWLESPKLPDVFVPGATVAIKPKHPRTTYGHEDALQSPLLGTVLGVDETGTGAKKVRQLLAPEAASEDIDAFVRGMFLTHSPQDRTALAGRLLTVVEAKLEALRATVLRPLALTVGASGIFPEEWGGEMFNAEALLKSSPGLTLSKAQVESGRFLVVPAPVGTCEDVVLATYATTAWYTTPSGMEEAKRRQKAWDAGEADDAA